MTTTNTATARYMRTMTTAELRFLRTYEAAFGARRMSALVASGKLICEKDADGVYLRDIAGRQYLDCFLATGVFTLGHRNPVVGRAMLNALEGESYSGVFYLSEAKGELSRRLAETSPDGLNVALPAVGGGEAMDLAIKLCTGATGRSGVVCCTKSYHGSAGVAAELGPPVLRDWYPIRALQVTQIEPGDLDALRVSLTENTAAVVMEPIRSLFDGKKADAAYWAEVRRLCDANGTRLIIDEVVCGMGRLGRLWGSELFGIQPDVVVTAKGLSGGYFPMAAAVVREDLLERWGSNPFRAYSSYAWSNVGARVALAAIEETERLLPVVAPIADALEDGLRSIAADAADVVEAVQRTGLHFILKTRPERVSGKDLTLRCLANGLLLQASGAYPEAPAKILPPLVLQMPHVDEICTKLRQSLAELTAG